MRRAFLWGMNIVIRRAEPHDVPRMLELVKELALFERAPEEVTVTLEHMREAGFGPDPVWTGWVAEKRSDGRTVSGSAEQTMRGSDHAGTARSADRIVGMAVCYVRYSTWKGRRLYLEDIIVTEAARGKGIGEKLFRACAAFALEQGHDGMTWQVLDWNTDAIRFYERLGTAFSGEWLNGSLSRDQIKLLAEGPAT